MSIETMHSEAPRGLALTARSIHPATDLCTLALLAQSGELTSSRDDALSLTGDAQARLASLAGERPAGYWSGLLRCAQVLALLKHEARHWAVIDPDSEMLGATQSECFPALMAVWLSQPPWLTSLMTQSGITDEPKSSTPMSMALLQFLGVFEAGVWYPLSSLHVMVSAVAERNGLSAVPEVFSRLLFDQVYLVLGACELGSDNTSFRVRPGLALPPISFLDQPLKCELTERLTPRCRADAYRALIARKLNANTAWTQVSEELARFREERRSRNASDGCLQIISGLKPRVATSPQIPFRDCLYLAQFGRLVPPSDKLQGTYVFELDRNVLPTSEHQKKELSGFLQERCCRASQSSVRDLFEDTAPAKV